MNTSLLHHKSTSTTPTACFYCNFNGTTATVIIRHEKPKKNNSEPKKMQIEGVNVANFSPYGYK